MVRVACMEIELLGGGIHGIVRTVRGLTKGKFWTNIIVDDRNDATRINNSMPERFSDALRVCIVARSFLDD
jgi:hypothetical protein